MVDNMPLWHLTSLHLRVGPLLFRVCQLRLLGRQRVLKDYIALLEELGVGCYVGVLIQRRYRIQFLIGLANGRDQCLALILF